MDLDEGARASVTDTKIPINKHRPKGTGLNRSLTPNLNQKRSQHLIDDISFSQDFIVCTCAWKGPIDLFQPHRKEEEPLVMRSH